MRNEKLLPCPLCGHVAFNGGGVMGASFIRSVRAEYKRIMKILYPEAFPKKSSERRRMTFACLTTGCPAKKTKLIHKAVKTLTLTCQTCGHVSKYYLDEQKVVKTEYR